jgi:hypothetical protein
MNQGKLVFAQLMRHLPLTTFRRCVARYRGEFKVKSFSCLDQFLCMAFAQLTYRESLRDIEVCLRAQRPKLYHLGIRSAVARNTLANANAARDWRIYADFAQRLIAIARPLYAQDPSASICRKPSTPSTPRRLICACRCFHGRRSARPRRPSSCAHCNIPTFIHISDGKMHEVNILDHLLPEPGAFYIMDRVCASS